jgi:hypothetical protein
MRAASDHDGVLAYAFSRRAARGVLLCSREHPIGPPVDTIGSIISPEPSAQGSDKVSVHGSAGCTPVGQPLVRSRDDCRFARAGRQLDADAAAQYRRASRSENTRRAYRSAFARLIDWGGVHGRTALPAFAGDSRRVSRLRGAPSAPRGDPLPAPARRLLAADRGGRCRG